MGMQKVCAHPSVKCLVYMLSWKISLSSLLYTVSRENEVYPKGNPEDPFKQVVLYQPQNGTYFSLGQIRDKLFNLTHPTQAHKQGSVNSLYIKIKGSNSLVKT